MDQGLLAEDENNREAKFYTLRRRENAPSRRRSRAGGVSPDSLTSSYWNSERNVETSSLLSPALRVLSRTSRRGRSRAGIDAHLLLLEEKFVAAGMSPEEARFAAKRTFGNIEQTKELQRDARSFRWLTGWAMELRLGVRMLVRYPGLTVVGGLAMAFAILVGAAVFEVVKRATNPVLPLPDGENIVGLTYWDRMDNVRKRASSYDFLTWREELTTLQNVGAFRVLERNLAANGGVGEPVMVAQISAAAFRMTRVPPLLGRTLVEADEKLGSPEVVVLGHRLWQTRFGGDQAVIGRTVRLGDIQATVAGVMPEGFAFPSMTTSGYRFVRESWLGNPATTRSRYLAASRRARLFGQHRRRWRWSRRELRHAFRIGMRI